MSIKVEDIGVQIKKAHDRYGINGANIPLNVVINNSRISQAMTNLGVLIKINKAYYRWNYKYNLSKQTADLVFDEYKKLMEEKKLKENIRPFAPPPPPPAPKYIPSTISIRDEKIPVSIDVIEKKISSLENKISKLEMENIFQVQKVGIIRKFWKWLW